MKAKINTLLICILLAVTVSHAQLKINEKTSLINLKANLEFLASDDLEGRETGTRGEKVAAQFIASELKKYGVKPYGDNGTYFQMIKLSTNVYDAASKMQVSGPDGTIDLSLGNDFLKSTGGVGDQSYLKNSAQVVFAGFGITAPEFKYDDYTGIDAAGKVVLVLPEEPYSEDNAYFNGTRTSKYAGSNSKIDNAMKHGAVGIIFLPESWRMKFWDTFKKSSMTGSFAPQRGKKSIPSIVLSEDAAKKVLNGEMMSFDDISAKMGTKAEFKAFPLKKKITFDLKENSQVKWAMNVVGIIEGTDAKLKNEFVLLSAHFDHIGVSNGVVNNGADDDGSGTISVLETARILNENKLNKRSVIALFNTGEEKGLWGSAFAAENGSYIPNTVADINIDMDGREHPDSIYVIGSNKLSTEYYNLIRDVNAKTVKLGFSYKYDDPNDRERFFYRSDHYNFALKGIPIVFFFDDMKSDYHKPTDDVEKINFEKVFKVVKLSANIAVKVANLNHRLVVDKKLE